MVTPCKENLLKIHPCSNSKELLQEKSSCRGERTALKGEEHNILRDGSNIVVWIANYTIIIKKLTLYK